MQREQAYKASPRYQADQAKANPDVGSGRVPAVGYTPTGPNVWGVPAGATVTELEKQPSGAYQVSYSEAKKPYHVKIEAPGAGFEGTVFAPNRQSVGQVALASYRVQVAGVNVGPQQLGGYVKHQSGRNQEVIQVGKPEVNEYWVGQGLPQYAAFQVPKAPVGEGFYIKSVEAGGLAPKVNVGNLVWEKFWTEQGYPEYGGFQPVEIPQDMKIRNITKTDRGLNVEFYSPEGVRQQLESKYFWGSKGYPELAGRYAPVAIPQGYEISGVEQSGEGLNVTFRSLTQSQSQVSSELTPEEQFMLSPEHQQLAGISRMMNTVGREVQTYNRQIAEAKNLDVTGAKSFTLEQVLKEESVFLKAFQEGKITPSLYAQASIFTTKQLISLTPETPMQANQFLPVESSAYVIAQGNTTWIKKGYSVVGTEQIQVPLTREQLTQRLNQFASVAYTPSTEAEALAKGASSYIPAETKKTFLSEVMKAYPSKGLTGEVLQVQGPPITKQISGTNLAKQSVANPLGTIGGILTATSTIVAQETGPIGTFVSAQIGGYKEIVNQVNQAKEALNIKTIQPKIITPSGIPTISKPVTYTVLKPTNPAEQFGMQTVRVGEAVTAIVLAPVLAPSFGVGAGTVVFGEGVGAVLTPTIKAILRQEVTYMDVLQGAGEGGVLSLIGAGALKAVSKIAPSITTPLVGQAPASAKAIAFAGRTAVNVSVDAGQAYVMSGGDIQETVKGAAFGAIFSVGVDVGGYALSKVHLPSVPLPKYGQVEIELEGGQKASWKGLYISKGENARLVYGKWGLPDDFVQIKTQGLTGEETGFVPKTNIEAEATIKYMEKAGYDLEIVQDVKDVRGLMKTTQYTKSKFIEDMLPIETQTLSQKGVATVKDFVLTNKADVDRLYGSFTQKAQISKQFEYRIVDAQGNMQSALRVPADIDIQLKIGGDKASDFAERLLTQLKRTESNVRISPEKPTLIETQTPQGAWRHALDIHTIDDVVGDVVPKQGWGFKVQKAPIKIEKIEVQSLGEQGVAKGISILGFKQDATLGPVTHRAKDIPDFFQVQRTLLESRGISLEATPFNRLIGRFNIGEIAEQPYLIQQEYVFSPASFPSLQRFTPIPYVSAVSATPTYASKPFTFNPSRAVSVAVQSPSPKISPTVKPYIYPSRTTQPSRSRTLTSPSTKVIGSIADYYPSKPSKTVPSITISETSRSNASKSLSLVLSPVTLPSLVPSKVTSKTPSRKSPSPVTIISQAKSPRIPKREYSSLVPSKPSPSPKGSPSLSPYPSPIPSPIPRKPYPSPVDVTVNHYLSKARTPLSPYMPSQRERRSKRRDPFGEWIKQKNPVKPYKAMLETFGVNAKRPRTNPLMRKAIKRKRR